MISLKNKLYDFKSFFKCGIINENVVKILLLILRCTMYNKKMYDLGSNPSAIRDLFEYGKRRKQEIGNEFVFDFSLGNPSVPAPSIVNETLTDLITNTDPSILHGYTSAVGDVKVRKSIAEYLNKTYKSNVSSDLIYLTVGAAASLTISLNAIVNEGDEVVVIAPFFPEYKVFVEKAGATLVTVASDEKTFLPDVEKIKCNINQNTKAIIINYPNNPTGVMIDHETLQALCEMLNECEKKYQHPIYLISDEPYRELLYNNIEYLFVTNYYKNSIVCYSFSKSLSLPGERIGYILVNPLCENAKEVYFAVCGAGRSLGFVCAPALFQYMIPKCLGYTSDLSVYELNRNLLYDNLTKIGYEVVKPDGAFYLFVKALEGDALSFCEKAKKYELLIVPSNSFGCNGYVRISYCVDTEMIKRSLSSFKALYDSYKEV